MNQTMHYIYALHRSKCKLNYIFGFMEGKCSDEKFRGQAVVYQILLSK